MSSDQIYRGSLAVVATLLAASIPLRCATKPGADWPRVFNSDGHQLQIFQPQLDDWTDGVMLKARFAALVVMKGSLKPAAGIISVEGRTETNHETRTVVIKDIEVSGMRFGIEDAKYREEVEKTAKKLFPKKKVTTSLDRLLAMLNQTEPLVQSVPVKTDPPVIYVSQKPARLLMFDGKPAFAPVQNTTDFYYAVNTNWDVFRKGTASTYYLLNDKQWLTASKLEGPWTVTQSLPTDFSALPANDNWKEVKGQIPPRQKTSAQGAPGIFYSEQPAELILTNGEPRLERIPGTLISYATNTESDLFWSPDRAQYYYLVAGRWFRAVSLSGPWTFTTNELPEEFSKIPADHPKGRVLASVPGTPEAREAVLQAQIPQLATVSRDEVIPPQVTYVGEPEFKPIDGTALWYAANTGSTVIQAGPAYYLCEKGVWFSSSTPKGPWALVEKVPQEIYTIPPSSPVHNVTYVKVYDSSPTQVTYGYTSGYTGAYVSGVTVVWGTGFYYPPYYYWGPMYPYPIYYYHPYTYGCGAYYGINNGAYYRGGYAYGPYGGWGYSAAYNPATGTYARRTAAYGPYGAATTFQAYNPRTGTYAGGYRAANPYQSWGQGVVTNGDDWVRGGYYSDSRGTAAGFRTSEGGAGIRVSGDQGQGGIVRTASGDIYAGKDGNVYRKQDGEWSQYEDGNWTTVEPPQKSTDQQQQMRQRGSEMQSSRASASATSAGQGRQVNPETYQNLSRDYQGRQRSSERSANYSTWRSSGADPRSYGGGARRGGGGRRRR